MFHRLAAPSYYIPGGGPLLPGYDYLNDPVGGGSGTGIASPADTGPKVGGTYDGTYFVAATEPASSYNTNRGLYAVGENTDELDDMLRRDLAIPVQQSFTAGGGGDATRALNGSVNNIYVSSSGATPLADLFNVQDSNGDEIVVSGSIVVVASITGAAVGAGFTSANPLTLNFNQTIPAGTNYKVTYAIRGNLATLPEDVFSFINIRTSDDNSAAITYIQAGGLDARYRNATTNTLGTVDQAGAGATITRDGDAPVVEATADNQDYTGFYDPYGAQYKTRTPGALVSGAALTGRDDGGTGYVAVLSRKRHTNVNDQVRPALNGAAFLSVLERANTASTFGGDGVRTRVVPGVTTSTSLNPTAGVTDDDRQWIELSPSDYFFNGSNRSEVAVGYDMLEVTFPDRDPQVYVITELDGGNPRRARLRNIHGGLPNFPSGVATTGVSFRFIKTHFMQGNTSAWWHAVTAATPDPVLLDYMLVAVPPPATDNPAVESRGGAPLFVAAALTKGQWGNQRPVALAWGGYNRDSWTFDIPGALRGDGAVETAMLLRLGYDGSGTTSISSSGASALTWHPSLEKSYLAVAFSHASGTATYTVTLDSGYSPENGEELIVTVRMAAGFGGLPTANVSIVWPADFVFADGDEIPDRTLGYMTTYTGRYDQPLGKFIMTRTVQPTS